MGGLAHYLEREGPLLSEYTEEAAYTESEGSWACPIDLKWTAGDLSADDKLVVYCGGLYETFRN